MRGVKTPNGQHLGVPRVWLLCGNIYISSVAATVEGTAGWSDPSQAEPGGLINGVGAGSETLNRSRYAAKVVGGAL